MNPFNSTILPAPSVHVDGGRIVSPATPRALGPKLGTSEHMEPALPGVAASLQEHHRSAVQAVP